MVELIAKSPLAGMTPVTIGGVTLREVDLGRLTMMAVFKGQEDALAAALKAAHSLALPKSNRATGKEGARAIWFGHRCVLLAGPAPDPSLAKCAALTDQSDAWCCVQLSGEGARDVLARLCPIDLRPAQFKRGHTSRTALQHMAASITRVGEHAFVILTFRSFAETLRHEIDVAMRGVAARQAR